MADDILTTKPVDVADVPEQEGVLTTLANLPPKAILREDAMARIFGVTPRTIRRMVARFEIPPSIILNGRASWFARRVLSWIEGRAEQREREAAGLVSKINAFGD